MSMRTATMTTILLSSALVISACSSDEDEEDGPVGSSEISQDQQQGDGSADGDSGQASDGGESNSEEAAEGAEAAYEQAVEDSEALGADEDYCDYQMEDQQFDDGEDFQAFLEDRMVVMERAAEVMTGFQSGDWNKDTAVIRANYLLDDGAQQSGIPEQPQSGDPAWDTAMDCGAEAEVRTEIVDDEVGDVEEDSHSPHEQIIAEYRWTGGDENCDLDEPDHYYLYTMTIGDEALITDFGRDQVNYEDDEPGLFDED